MYEKFGAIAYSKMKLKICEYEALTFEIRSNEIRIRRGSHVISF